MPTSRAPRKKSKKRRPLVRGEPVVQSVLSITLDELARVGFASLRVEDVATRAKVNKTTVYRRWSTKASLVRAALLSIVGGDIHVPDTGSLRGDLVEIGHQLAELATSPRWRSIIRMVFTESPDSELRAIAQSLRDSYEPEMHKLIAGAVARGEVPDLAAGVLALETFDAAIQFRLFVSQVGVDARFIERLADLLGTVRPLPPRKAERRPVTRAGASPRPPLPARGPRRSR